MRHLLRDAVGGDAHAQCVAIGALEALVCNRALIQAELRGADAGGAHSTAANVILDLIQSASTPRAPPRPLAASVTASTRRRVRRKAQPTQLDYGRTRPFFYCADSADDCELPMHHSFFQSRLKSSVLCSDGAAVLERDLTQACRGSQ